MKSIFCRFILGNVQKWSFSLNVSQLVLNLNRPVYTTAHIVQFVLISTLFLRVRSWNKTEYSRILYNFENCYEGRQVFPELYQALDCFCLCV